MADGWRNRYMAPFYALAISFVLVLLVGFTLDAPEASKIKFSDDTFPVTGAVVVADDEVTVLDKAADLKSLEIDEQFVVCGQLSNGWSAKKAKKATNSGFVCWGPYQPDGKSFVLDVEKSR